MDDLVESSFTMRMGNCLLTLEVGNLYVSGLILPLKDIAKKEKTKGVRFDGFGCIEEWGLSGYEGYPVIWLLTKIADYDCIKPSSS